MSKQRWFDCDGVELQEGDLVKDICTGKVEKVYECHPSGRPDDVSLGLNASNERFLELHPEWRREIYPFDQFEYYLKRSSQHSVNRCLVQYKKVV